MSGNRYHICQVNMGWVGLVASDVGLCRLSFQPTPQDLLEDLGSSLDHATEDADSFTQVVACLERYFQGETDALDEIKLDLRGVPPFFGAAYTAGRDTQLRLAGRRGRQALGRPRGRTGDGQKPLCSDHTVSPGHSQQRRPSRLRGRRSSG